MLRSKWEIYQNRIVGMPELLKRISVLLEEGYTLHESIEIMLSFHTKNDLYWQEKIKDVFKRGESTERIFEVLGLGRKHLLLIQIAEKTGTLSNSLNKLGAELEVQSKAIQKTKKALFYPFFLFVFIFVLFLLFRQYFLPNMEQMMSSRNGLDSSVLSLQLSKWFLRVPDTILLFIGLISIAVTIALYVLSKKSVPFQLKIIQSIPIIRYFWRLILTRHFAFVLGRLLLYGWSLQEALHVIKEQSFHRQLSYIAKMIEERVLYGDSLSRSVEMFDFFYYSFSRFIIHGEKIGMLGRELVIYADLLSGKINGILITTTKIVQPIMLAIIAVCVVAAYLSILLPLYNMMDFV